MKKAGLVLALLLAGLTQAIAAPPPTLDDIRAVMVGTWQSLDDSKFSRELDADGTSIDRHDDDASATSHGVWRVFNGATAPAGLERYKLSPDGVYMQLQQNGDVLLFALTAASLSSLEMVYLERGNTLSFVRLK